MSLIMHKNDKGTRKRREEKRGLEWTNERKERRDSWGDEFTDASFAGSVAAFTSVGVDALID